MGEDDGKQAYEELIYVRPNHSKLYGKAIRRKQGGIRRRLVPPYRHMVSEQGKTAYHHSTNVERSGTTKGKLINLEDNFTALVQQNLHS